MLSNAGLCFSIGRSIERRFPLVGRLKIVGRMVFVCQSVSQSVSMCVQAFSGITCERLVRSGRGWYPSTPRNAGTTMVPVTGRSVARDTWHVPPCKGLQKNYHAPTSQTGRTTDSKIAGHMHAIPTCVLLGLPFLWGAGCTCPGRKTFLTWDPPA